MTNHILSNISANSQGEISRNRYHSRPPHPPSALTLSGSKLDVQSHRRVGRDPVQAMAPALPAGYLQTPQGGTAMRQFRLGLILFFVGLIDFLQGLNMKVSIPVTVLIGVGFTFLVVTTSAPAFQYVAIIRHYYFGWYMDHPALFALKSPQSLAVLHLVTWLFPLSADSKVSDWASLELEFFSSSSALRTYTGRALTWLDETYSHSLNMARQICLCLQDVEDEDVQRGGDQIIFNTTRRSRATKVKGHVKRDIIAMRYLRPKMAMSFNQCFIVLEHLIRALNSSHYQTPSLWPFIENFDRLQRIAYGPAEQIQLEEVIWQRAILFRNLLSEGRWTDSTKIPMEVWNVFKNLKIFTDEDLNSIFNVLYAWMDQHPEDADLPSHCWVPLTSQLASHELDEALQYHPPVRDFMAFLDSRFRMGDGIKYLCTGSGWNRYNREAFDSFFKALYAWIERNPQDAQSFIHCKELLSTMDSRELKGMRDYRSFRDFEASLQTLLEAQIERHEGVAMGPALNS
ncbi:hypothetical protein BD779DRAFT_1795784 [Infundibulicybe gibba]|nr:hypothetical protein BD779DRAFT_1795784 [Infundibulicybe gibba]